MEADCCYLNRGLVIGCRVMRAAAVNYKNLEATTRATRSVEYGST